MEKCSTNFVPSQKLCASWFCMNMRSSIRKVLATCSFTDIVTNIPNHNYKMNLARVTSRWNWCFVIIIALSTTLNFTHRFHFSIYKTATTTSGIMANDSRAFFSSKTEIVFDAISHCDSFMTRIHALFDHFIQNHKSFRSLSKPYQLWSNKIEWVSSLFFIIKITFVLNKTQWSSASAFVLCSIDSDQSYLLMYIYNLKMYAFSFRFVPNNKDAEYAHRVHCTVCSRLVSHSQGFVCAFEFQNINKNSISINNCEFLLLLLFLLGVCISFDLNNKQIRKYENTSNEKRNAIMFILKQFVNF